MIAAEYQDAISIEQRLAHLARRERMIRTVPTSNVDDIITQDENLESITQEKRELARMMKELREHNERQRQEKADQNALECNEALKQAAMLRTQLLKKLKGFDEFVALYHELMDASQKAFTSNEHLKRRGDERAQNLDNLSAERFHQRTRKMIIDLFGTWAIECVDPVERLRIGSFSLKGELESLPVTDECDS